MNKTSLIAIIVIILGLAAYFYFQHVKKNTTFESATFTINHKKYNLDIAKSPAQLAVGLGGRKSICDRCGMIFIFNYDGVLPFWMKNTLIPLDIIWIDKNQEIVSIQTAPIENDIENPLKVYTNDIPARYVIELNAGTAKELGLKIGDKIELSPILNK